MHTLTLSGTIAPIKRELFKQILQLGIPFDILIISVELSTVTVITNELRIYQHLLAGFRQDRTWADGRCNIVNGRKVV